MVNHLAENQGNAQEIKHLKMVVTIKTTKTQII